MWRTGVESGDGDGIEGLGDDRLEVLREELTMQRVGAVIDEIFGGHFVGTQDGDVRKVGMGRRWLDLERESWGESPVTARGVAEEETIRL